MHCDDVWENGGEVEGFQIWVNLPAKDKMIPPAYQDTPSENIPVVTSSDGKIRVKVIAGQSMGQVCSQETNIFLGKFGQTCGFCFRT